MSSNLVIDLGFKRMMGLLMLIMVQDLFKLVFVMLINILLGLDIRETFKVSKFYRKLLSFTGTFNGSLVNSVLTGSFSTNSLSVRTNLFNIMAEAGLGSSVS
jgi:hypothetical protein